MTSKVNGKYLNPGFRWRLMLVLSVYVNKLHMRKEPKESSSHFPKLISKRERERDREKWEEEISLPHLALT